MADPQQPPATPETSEGIPFYLSAFRHWAGLNPVLALLLAMAAGTLVYFFFFVHVFVEGAQSAAYWAWMAWNETGQNQEHSKIVPFISLFLVWYHREQIRRAPKEGSNKGSIYIAIGVLFFILSVRCLQPRMALAAFPVLVFGTVYYLWGRAVARIVLFPCAFMIFTIPFAALEQATFRLQFVITGMVSFLTNLVGINIQAIGTTLTANDGSFQFEIAEGCSGIKSLTAMAMLTAVYVHLTQKELWKKLTILLFSAIFAIIGNAGRIFTVMLVARFYDPKIAGGIYHDYSGFVFFPFALAAMIGFSRLLNMDFKKIASTPEQKGPGGEVTYDY